ncbi:hypothetical protein QG37_06965 [Candidozyma auris]|nr:hypothetical protein QG37_06965 [[Candida] auris]
MTTTGWKSDIGFSVFQGGWERRGFFFDGVYENFCGVRVSQDGSGSHYIDLMLGEDIVWSCLWRARCVQAKPRVFGGDILITWLGFSPRNYHYALVNSRLRKKTTTRVFAQYDHSDCIFGVGITWLVSVYKEIYSK